MNEVTFQNVSKTYAGNQIKAVDDLTLSLNANITFLRAVSGGYVYAEAVETFNHAKVPFIEVRITDEEGCPVAVFTSSGYRKKTELNLESLM